jgi:hypothetical protein
MSGTASGSGETFHYFVGAMNRFAPFAMTDGKDKRKERKNL